MFKKEIQIQKHDRTIEESYKKIKECKKEIQEKSQQVRKILNSEDVCLIQEDTKD